MSKAAFSVEQISGVKARRMPNKIEPMKATLVDEPFSRPGWVFENKWDGVRAVCFIKNGSIKLSSRNQKDMTIRYPELHGIASAVTATEAILDGEIVVLDKSGRVAFQLLQSRFGLTNKEEIDRLRKSQNIVYYVFDIVYLDGYDLRDAVLLDRKRALKSVLKRSNRLKFSAHIADHGIEFFREAEKAKLEGIMAKNGKSKYEERRSNEWLKIKTQQRQEVIIVGYTEPRGSREYFGALHIAAYNGKKLQSLGHVGTGFNQQKLRDLHRLMKPLETKHHPFDAEPEKPSRRDRNEVTHWLKPKLVCEVSFTEFTDEGRLRHPVFEGLRDDKHPRDCKLEVEHDVKQEVMAAEAKTRRAPAKSVGASLKKLTERSKAKRTNS
jgi:bifunctional non-homologous end joining protein LigD